MDAAFDKRNAGQDQEVADFTANRARLEAESDKLLAQHSEHHTGGRAFLHDSLRLLTDAHRAYAHSGDGNGRLASQAFYTRLDITDDEQLRPRLSEPFATIFREAHDSGNEGKEAKREHSTFTDVACSRKALWVDLLHAYSKQSHSVPGPARFKRKRC